MSSSLSFSLLLSLTHSHHTHTPSLYTIHSICTALILSLQHTNYLYIEKMNKPAISEVDCEFPRAVLVQLRDFRGGLDVANDLVPLLRVLAAHALPWQVPLGQEVVENIGQGLQVVPSRLLLPLQTKLVDVNKHLK